MFGIRNDSHAMRVDTMLYLAAALLFQSLCVLILVLSVRDIKIYCPYCPIYLCTWSLCFVLKQIMFRARCETLLRAAVQLFATFVAEQFTYTSDCGGGCILSTGALTGAANGDRTLMHFIGNYYC